MKKLNMLESVLFEGDKVIAFWYFVSFAFMEDF